MSNAKELLNGRLKFTQERLGLVNAMTKQAYKSPKNESTTPAEIVKSRENFNLEKKEAANLIAKLSKKGKDFGYAMEQLAPKTNQSLAL